MAEQPGVVVSYGGGEHRIVFPAGIELTELGGRIANTSTTRADNELESRAAPTTSLRQATKPLLVVNDHHRATPTAQILSVFDAADSELLDRCSYLVATGTHRVEHDDHLKAVFGHHLDRIRDRITVHDCHDRRQLEDVGVDQFGERFSVNHQLFDHDLVQIINSVEPHYFAGYTGGRKSLIPGLADIDTIARNHNLAVSLDCQPLRLDGNPVNEHLEAMVDQLAPTLPVVDSLQMVVGGDGEIASVYQGDLKSSWLKATADAHDHFAETVGQQFDVVLAILDPPLDNSLYQAQKGLENCQMAVADGGAIAVLAACPDGIGSPFFFDLALSWDRDANRPADGQPRFGMHKLARVNALTRRITVALLSNVSPADARTVFYEPITDLESWIADVLARPQSRNRVLVVRNAGHTVVSTRR